MQSITIHLIDVDHTRKVGALLGMVLLTTALNQALTVHLNGELGAGKTTFVSGLLNAMGHAGVVRSPTYTLIEPYQFIRHDAAASALQIVHMDLYRLTDPSQLEELGVRDMLLPDTVLLIEWPERAGDYLPHADVEIHLAYPEAGMSGRTLYIIAHSLQAKQLLHRAYSQYISGP